MNYLLWVPLLFVLASFLDLTWFSCATPDKHYPAREGPLLISALVLIITTLVTIYYWRDYSVIYHAMWERIPLRAVQVNDAYNWLLPTYS